MNHSMLEMFRSSFLITFSSLLIVCVGFMACVDLKKDLNFQINFEIARG